jgi:signal transduction histidine kinase
MQDRVSISLHSLPEELCSHIVTDKQWLQENILCLLSNAVKYSSLGKVDVKISLEKSREAEKKIDLLTRSSSETGMCSINVDDNDEEPILDTDEFLFKSRPNFHKSTSSIDNSVETNCEAVGSPKSFLKVEVEDHGIGLSEEAMKSLFSAAKQAQRLAGGTGKKFLFLVKRNPN